MLYKILLFIFVANSFAAPSKQSEQPSLKQELLVF